jgi:hypothetical protein
MKLRRVAFLAALAALNGFAFAESYAPYVYGVPAGYSRMAAYGAGDNGMLTGQGFSTSNGRDQAVYVTTHGVRDMHPPGWGSSVILDSWAGTYHVGAGLSPSGFNHALYWIGGTNNPVDLHPANAPTAESFAQGGFGQIQVGRVVGVVNGVNVSSACMWSRTAVSFKLLTSPNHVTTSALGTDAVVEVGMGWHPASSQWHALRWRGPGSNPVDMHPSDADGSVADCVDGDQIGGYTYPTSANAPEAALWTMTSTQTVYSNLHPADTFSTSEVRCVRAGIQVGIGLATGPQRTQAIMWHGDANSWIDLHSMLPPMFQSWHSYANDIDNLGNVVGYVENAGILRPVIWMRVP